MSLVADYTDSDENSDSGNREGGDTGSVSNGRNKNLKLSSSISAIGAQSVKNGGNKGNFLLQEEDSSSSELDSDGESEAIRSRKKSRKQASPIKLSNPFRTVTGDVNVSKEESVFRNPFREKEDQRIAVLEHHVKMTDNPETVTTINGKKICWNYRKRKCYLGTQCPFAHDSDVPLTEEQLKEQKLENDQQRSAGGNVNTNRSVNLQLSSATKPSHLPATASVVAGTFDSNAFFSSPHLGGGGDPKRKTEMADDLDELDKQQSNKSKKRVGLTNSLIPAKRALNLYRKTKDK
ncbi:Zinc finger CCCH domain-containing protein 8 [Orchesella cincta]|uniref:Zinc finger CCCH domain-containing protein 8 n=1 Tax=Orchesella cincta TaxID=48709 RepID=A0A1D2MPH8_ORCCI|nr:Zinc finger CCCH domain-containing protein 8 [Orchesella cincta]